MNTISRTHKIRLDITCKQEVYFRKACGVARFAWNWALAKWEEKYKANIKTSAFELKKEFNALKSQQFPWTYEVTKYASQQPFIYIQRAFQGFFAKRTKYPKFKKKGVRDSFYIGGDQIKIKTKAVKIPNLGWVRMKELLRFDGKINGATISCTAGNWFIALSVETSQRPPQCENQASVGVDLGVKNLATLSNGEIIPSNKSLKIHLKKLKRLQRKVSRRQKGSKNRDKAKKAVAQLHYKIANSRNDTIHKLTTHLSNSFQKIVIEDLDVSQMLGHKKLSRQIMNGGWYECRRQLAYKAELKGCELFIADKWFASSKQCSGCGHVKKELLLSERIYKCCDCSLEIDRDLNAAICLKQLINTVSFTGIDACGQDGSVIMLKTLLQPAWKKQELSHV
jgi:putative transposase